MMRTGRRGWTSSAMSGPLQLDRAGLLPDDPPLSPARGNGRRKSVQRHAPIERRLYAAFQSPQGGGVQYLVASRSRIAKWLMLVLLKFNKEVEG